MIQNFRIVYNFYQGWKTLFGKNNTIALDCYGDSMPMYAIYQLQTKKLTYKVVITFIAQNDSDIKYL